MLWRHRASDSGVAALFVGPLHIWSSRNRPRRSKPCWTLSPRARFRASGATQRAPHGGKVVQRPSLAIPCWGDACPGCGRNVRATR